jgi:alkyldihydroxyacetonephosphate synthase
LFNLNILFSRYPIGELELPYFTEWTKETFNVNLSNPIKAQPAIKNFPEPIINNGIHSKKQALNFNADVCYLPEFLNEIKSAKVSFSLDGMDRLFRGHGHTLQDIYMLRVSMFPRIPDLVVWPGAYF